MESLIEDNEFVKLQTKEATEEYLLENIKDIFQRYSELESFSWCQKVQPTNPVEDFEITGIETEYSFRQAWKEFLLNDLIWTFQLIDPLILIELYGKNVKVVVTENGIEIE